ncbi:balbiani ring protein 3-like isoform X2 [Ornithodoros turicata]|uniref:balbiani ring protein 3-like isoform X2 n=1 Tax=Ornithodoros turicata TaxID=34597 RepID=UPI00313942F7
MASKWVVVIVVLCTTLEVVVSQRPPHWSHQYKHPRRSLLSTTEEEDEDMAPDYQPKEEENCNLTALEQLAQSTYCRPRMDFEILSRPNDHSILYPEAVRVERCSGGCFGAVTCSAVTMENVTVPVIRFNMAEGGTLQCTEVTVVRHKTCHCGCTKKESDCGEYQHYNRDTCSCECTNDAEKERCRPLSPPMRWNSYWCFCQCPEWHSCGSPQDYFDQDLCSCQPFMTNLPDAKMILNVMKPLEWTKLPPPL